MLNKYNIDFNNLIWDNIRPSIRRTGESGIWYRFLYSIFRLFEGPLMEKANYTYNQIFIEYSDINSLKKRAAHLGLDLQSGEDSKNLKKRIKAKRASLRKGISVPLIKNIFRIYLNVEAEIVKSDFFETDVFTVGVTPAGEGICISSDYLRFAWVVYLPDLSFNYDLYFSHIEALQGEIFTVGATAVGVGRCVNSNALAYWWKDWLPGEDPTVEKYRKLIREQTNELFPNIEIIVLENRPEGPYKWRG